MLPPHALDAANPLEGHGAKSHARAMRLLLVLLEWLAAARTRSELRQLSDRSLRDIGVARRDIDSLFR
jgi:uncharacterized protein YjiS (DUF1127 family)